jgi:hypothetical protein
MNCTITTIAAPGNGVNANTIVSIVYGTIMLTIASIEIFLDFEDRKYRQAKRNGKWPVLTTSSR